jgi:hypothetical protein
MADLEVTRRAERKSPPPPSPSKLSWSDSYPNFFDWTDKAKKEGERMRKLTEAQVRERLKSYDDAGVTDELYEFGKMLVAEMIDRNKVLDGKAAAMLAYSIGVITLLSSTFGVWAHRVPTLFLPLPAFAGVVSLVAACFAVYGLTLKRFEGISQNDWLQAECLGDRERLRRFHVINMWAVVNSHEAVTEDKANAIGRAQVFLFLAGAVLFVSLVYAAIVF